MKQQKKIAQGHAEDDHEEEQTWQTDHVNIFPPQRGKYWRGDDSPLRMEVREQNKIVELWLTREEKETRHSGNR